MEVIYTYFYPLHDTALILLVIFLLTVNVSQRNWKYVRDVLLATMPCHRQDWGHLGVCYMATFRCRINMEKSHSSTNYKTNCCKTLALLSSLLTHLSSDISILSSSSLTSFALQTKVFFSENHCSQCYLMFRIPVATLRLGV